MPIAGILAGRHCIGVLGVALVYPSALRAICSTNSTAFVLLKIQTINANVQCIPLNIYFIHRFMHCRSVQYGHVEHVQICHLSMSSVCGLCNTSNLAAKSSVSVYVQSVHVILPDTNE